MPVATVGSINSSKLANDLWRKAGCGSRRTNVSEESRGGLGVGGEIGVEINLPNQIRWGFGGRQGVKGKK